jgi:hypothetical protein
MLRWGCIFCLSVGYVSRAYKEASPLRTTHRLPVILAATCQEFTLAGTGGYVHRVHLSGYRGTKLPVILAATWGGEAAAN